MRNINLDLLEMNTRTNASNLSSKIIPFEEVPQEVKKMIDLKYDLRKIEKALTNDKSNISRLKEKIGMRKLNSKRNQKETSKPCGVFTPSPINQRKNILGSNFQEDFSSNFNIKISNEEDISDSSEEVTPKINPKNELENLKSERRIKLPNNSIKKLNNN